MSKLKGFNTHHKSTHHKSTHQKNTQHKALFLDRDGVINVNYGYVSDVACFDWVDGIFELVEKAQKLDYKIIVVTNQSGIGRGYYDEAQFQQLTQWMNQEFTKHGVNIAAVKFCPHHPEKALPEYLRSCNCRKPQPGMILEAIRELNIDPAQSIFVGDKESDMKAARSANVQFKYLVESGQTFSDQQAKAADAVFNNLTELKQSWFAQTKA